MVRWSAPLLVLAASLVWGTTGTAATFMDTGVSPFAVGSAAMSVGGLLLAAIFAARVLRVLRHGAARRWVALGGVAVLVYALAFYSGMHMAGVAVGTVLNIGSAPVFAAVLERFVDQRRIAPQWTVGTSVGVVGLVAVVLGSEPLGDGTRAELGVALSLLAGGLYALYTYASRRALEHVPDAAGVMASMFGLGGALLLPVLLLTGSPILRSPQSMAVAAYLAIAAVALAYWAFGVALRQVTASTATTITLVEPVIAAILAAVVVGEHVGPMGWLGVGLVVVGVLIATTMRSPGLGRSPAELMTPGTGAIAIPGLDTDPAATTTDLLRSEHDHHR